LIEGLEPLFTSIIESPEVKNLVRKKTEELEELKKKHNFLVEECERLEKFETYYNLEQAMRHPNHTVIKVEDETN